MTNEIRPALSAEEWAAREYTDAEHDEGAALVRGLFAVHDGSGGTRYFSRPHAIMALANASLPDDDPRKLTWEDVDMLRQPYINMPNLAARIAALLPPREEG